VILINDDIVSDFFKKMSSQRRGIREGDNVDISIDDTKMLEKTAVTPAEFNKRI
jgi:hypothetical protein